MKKESTVYSMALAIFHAEAKKGHMKWNVTEVASASGFSRSLYYQYMGRSKKEMLKSALKIFTDHFYGFSKDKSQLKFSDQIREARKTVIENPQVSVFYQKWRHQKSWIQDEFIKTEEQFQKRLQIVHPNLSKSRIDLVHGIVHGLVTAPFLTDEEAYLAANEINMLLLTGSK